MSRGEAAKASLDKAELVTVVQIDVTDADSVRAAVKTIEAALDGQKLFGLINNAGSVFGGGMGFSTSEAFNMAKSGN